MAVTPPPPPAAAPASTPRPWWQRTWAIISAIIAVVGAVTGVVGILPFVFRNATTLDSLTIAVEPAEAHRSSVFAVPVTADWDSFPTSQSLCDDQQLGWLDANGTKLTERFLVTVSNVAGEGAMLSLKDFRGEGDVTEPDPIHIAVTCDQSGGGAGNLRAALIDPSTGRVGVYVPDNQSAPVAPLVFNVAPGENGQFALLIRSGSNFAGTVVFTEALGAETRTVELPIEGGINVPGTATTRFIVEGGQLVCDGIDDCVPADVIAMLRGAAG